MSPMRAPARASSSWGELGGRAAVPFGLLLGAAADAVFADPRRWHPVAGFGRAALAGEAVLYRDDRRAGAVHLALFGGGPSVATWLLQRTLPWHGRMALTGAVTAVALGGASLRREACSIADRLRAGDLASARHRLTSLCGRDPSGLDAGEVARATVESVAENTSDAVVGTLVYGALFGPAGVVLHRTVNTLDAMVGYRTTRYQAFGWPAARVDDLLNLLPARVTALLTVALTGTVGGQPIAAWRTWRRDADGHPSPNAGPVEAAAAGALGVTLGGSTNVYGDVTDRRPSMGDGPPPRPDDVDRAVRLSTAVGAATLTLAVLTAARRSRR